jgi:hypothetical protein
VRHTRSRRDGEAVAVAARCQCSWLRPVAARPRRGRRWSVVVSARGGTSPAAEGAVPGPVVPRTLAAGTSNVIVRILLGPAPGRRPIGRPTPCGSATPPWTVKRILVAGLIVVETWIWRRASRDRPRDPDGARLTCGGRGARASSRRSSRCMAAVDSAVRRARASTAIATSAHTAGVAAGRGRSSRAWSRSSGATTRPRRACVGPLARPARNLVWIDIVVSWVACPGARAAATEMQPPPDARRRCAHGRLDAVLPFDAE